MADVLHINQDTEALQNYEFYNELYGSRTYSYDAVSGAQIQVSLNNRILVDDCTAVQFTLTQAKKPIYGYASQLFDAVAPGVVIVHGRLWMNFIHQGYLRLLIESAHKGVDLLAGYTDKVFKESDIPTSPDELVGFIKTRNEQAQRLLSETFKSDSQLLKPRPDEKLHFNIYIDYGPRSEFRQGSQSSVPRKVIYQAHIIGEGQDNQISGQPVQEWYEFIAQRVT